jgi:hypothetical protein
VGRRKLLSVSLWIGFDEILMQKNYKKILRKLDFEFSLSVSVASSRKTKRSP